MRLYFILVHYFCYADMLPLLCFLFVLFCFPSSKPHLNDLKGKNEQSST